MTPRLESAIAFAAHAHAGQVDKAGQPYILHPLRVMLSCEAEDRRVAAVLHDTAEDCDVSLEELAARFGEDVAAAVDALTRRPGETYGEFIERCAENRIALDVKLADLADNMNLSRLGCEPSEEDTRRQARYAEAKDVLVSARQRRERPANPPTAS